MATSYEELESMLSAEEKVTDVFKAFLKANKKHLIEKTGLAEDQLDNFIDNLMIV